jgi:hypothetical protein
MLVWCINCGPIQFATTGIGTLIVAGALTGCSGSSLSAPDWLNAKSSTAPVQAVQFESEPPGANVRTALGLTCQTPCSLAVMPQTQSVTFEKNGFQARTVQISVNEPTEDSLFSNSPAPALIPNPVRVALQPDRPPAEPIVAVPQPKPVARQAPPPIFNHYWPTSAPMTPQPETSPAPPPQPAQ